MWGGWLPGMAPFPHELPQKRPSKTQEYQTLALKGDSVLTETVDDRRC